MLIRKLGHLIIEALQDSRVLIMTLINIAINMVIAFRLELNEYYTGDIYIYIAYGLLANVCSLSIPAMIIEFRSKDSSGGQKIDLVEWVQLGILAFIPIIVYAMLFRSRLNEILNEPLYVEYKHIVPIGKQVTLDELDRLIGYYRSEVNKPLWAAYFTDILGGFFAYRSPVSTKEKHRSNKMKPEHFRFVAEALKARAKQLGLTPNKKYSNLHTGAKEQIASICASNTGDAWKAKVAEYLSMSYDSTTGNFTFDRTKGKVKDENSFKAL